VISIPLEPPPPRVTSASQRFLLLGLAATLSAALIALAALFLGSELASGQSAPTVTSVVVSSTPAADQTYALGDKVRIRLTFSELVVVTGTPRLKIDMDPAHWGQKWATYNSGSGAAYLDFIHEVVEPNFSTQGIAVLANTLQLNGGAIRSVGSGQDADLAHEGLAHNASHKVDWQRSRPEPQPKPSPSLQRPLLETLLQKPDPVQVSSFSVNSVPGSLTVSVDWADVPGASSYLVRWRDGGYGVKLNDGVTVATSEASITVGYHGEWVVKVSACSMGGCSRGIPKRFQVEAVEQPNQAPLVDEDAEQYASFVGTHLAPRGILVSKDFAGIFSDPDGDDLTYTLTTPTDPNGLIDTILVMDEQQRVFIRLDADADWSSIAPALVDPLVTTITLTATDPDGLSVSLSGDFQTKAVEQPNRAPLVDENAEQYASFVGTHLAPRGILVSKDFAGIFSDPDGDDLTYTLTTPTDPNGLIDTILVTDDQQRVFIQLDDDADWSSVAPALADPLVTTITLTATDPDGLSVSLSGDFQTDWASHPALIAAAATTWWMELTFDQDLQQQPSPTKEQFTVKAFVNGSESATNIPVRKIRVHRNEITLFVEDGFSGPDSITLDYVHIDDTPLKRAAGGDATPGFVGQSVAIPSPNVPATLDIDSTPGELDIIATWNPSRGASTYLLSWRRVDGTLEPGDETTVSGTTATIEVADFGEWIVSTQACNVTGCSSTIARTIDVREFPSPGLAVGATRGELMMQATWQVIPEATSYKLRWRLEGDDHFDEANQLSTTTTEATLTASGNGHWVVALEACDDSGCTHRGDARAGVLALDYFTPVCDRTPVVKEALERETGKSCDSIVARDLAALDGQLRLSGLISEGNGNWTRVPPMKAVRTGDFDGLTGITYLDLNADRLTSLPGGIFHGLSSLTGLTLSRNDLTVLPVGVFDDLSSLKFLTLYETGLTELQPDVFDELNRLQSLTIAENALTELPAGVFDNLSNLTWLRLSGNKNLSTLPAGVFNGLDSLTRVLNLSYNNLTTLPTGVFEGLSSLKFLALAGNDMEELSDSTFSGLSGLSTLLLQDNAITTIEEGAFGGLSKIQTLLLQDNAITTIEEGAFSGLSKIQGIALDRNELASLPASGLFDELTTLSWLLIEDNKLTELPDGVFDHLTNLRTLKLGSNSLSELTSDLFDNLTNLATLRLSGNPGYPFDLNLGDGVTIE